MAHEQSYHKIVSPTAILDMPDSSVLAKLYYREGGGVYPGWYRGCTQGGVTGVAWTQPSIMAWPD